MENMNSFVHPNDLAVEVNSSQKTKLAHLVSRVSPVATVQWVCRLDLDETKENYNFLHVPILITAVTKIFKRKRASI